VQGDSDEVDAKIKWSEGIVVGASEITRGDERRRRNRKG